MSQEAAAGVGPGGAVSPAAGGRTRAAGCGPRRLRVEGRGSGLGLASTAWAPGVPLSLAGPRWSGRHSAGALFSLALTRRTDFFALGRRVQRGGCGALLVARRRELAGGGGASECARSEPGDMTNFSEIQIGESASVEICKHTLSHKLATHLAFFTLQ